VSVSLDSLSFHGSGLERPECVLATRAGALFVSDWGGGVTRIGPDGRQTRFLARDRPGLRPNEIALRPNGIALRPNGIALRRDGSFLLAHLGEEDGGVFQLARDGTTRPLLTEVEGAPLPPTNFVLEDGAGRIWVTVSTRLVPRARGYSAACDDGFIVLVDGSGARIVADGLGYTNELGLDADGAWLYVNETFARRLTRFRVADDGSLSDRETVAEFGPGVFPDGLAFDAEGGVWIASVVSNRVIRVHPDGRQELVLDDSDAEHLAWVEAAYRAGGLGRPHLDAIRSRRLRNVSSLAFGGPDLRTIYLGCLLGDAVASFPAPVAGRPPVHWEVAA
jgi:sugar lactone lactonase YvrE